MKNLISCLLLVLSITPAKAYFAPEELPLVNIVLEDPTELKIIKSYCLGGIGNAIAGSTEISTKNIHKCDAGFTSQYYYEQWALNNTNPSEVSYKDLNPKLNEKDSSYYKLLIARMVLKEKDPSKYSKCEFIYSDNKHYAKCDQDKNEITNEIQTIFNSPEFPKKIAEAIFAIGKSSSEAYNPDFKSQLAKKNGVVNKKTGTVATETNAGQGGGAATGGVDAGAGVTIKGAGQSPGGTSTGGVLIGNSSTGGSSTGGSSTGGSSTGGSSTGGSSTGGSSTGGSSTGGSSTGGSSTGGSSTGGSSTGGSSTGGSSTGGSGGVVTTPEKVDEKPEVAEDKNCAEELRQAIAGLLADDKKNIIGLQYEVTVLKMTSLAMSNQTNTLEGFIKKQSKQISEMDNGIIEKMNAMYKKHGLTEDAQKVSDNLKMKAKSAHYQEKNKRFFNDSSSAFLLAYQQINKDAGIKDQDVSVLWFMDKVAQRAKTKHGNFSSQHNRTNLSTRITQYTGAVNPKVAKSKDAVDEMLKKQKAKVDREFLALIEDFKTSNQACYNKLFSDGADECNLSVVEAEFSQLLAINSKIASTELIDLDAHLVGGIDKARFSINIYMDTPDTAQKRDPAATPKKKEPKVEEPKTEVPPKKDEPKTEEPENQPGPEDEVQNPPSNNSATPTQAEIDAAEEEKNKLLYHDGNY